ncbi:phage tail protein [Chimaeribacter arupi]|uniref:Phage tail protein n=1 Tax=Chimaeribacter arupi TaxID=2060066 RepID=A0A2N5EJA5_9GAMM|nr:phage tail protein [Chimaeribacter arupi]PLR45427.1 phage tail protein [Chimaeribacter arupi]
MLKPAQLREALTRSVPLLQSSPDCLHMFIDNGRIASTLAASLSFEYQYQLNLVITDYAGDIDLIVVPVLAWLRENQPDIMATKERRESGFVYRADVISDTLCDISIDLQLTERVIVKQLGEALHVDHVPEPPEPENAARPAQLYINRELVSEWQA